MSRAGGDAPRPASRRGRCRSIAVASLPPSRRKRGLLGLEGQTHSFEGIGGPGRGAWPGFRERTPRPARGRAASAPAAGGPAGAVARGEPRRSRRSLEPTGAAGSESPRARGARAGRAARASRPTGPAPRGAAGPSGPGGTRGPSGRAGRRPTPAPRIQPGHAASTGALPRTSCHSAGVALHEAEERPDGVHEGVGQVGGGGPGIDLLPAQMDLDHHVRGPRGPGRGAASPRPGPSARRPTPPPAAGRRGAPPRRRRIPRAPPGGACRRGIGRGAREDSS